MHKKQLKLSPQLYLQTENFGDMVLNKLNNFFNLPVLIFLNRRGKIKKLKVQKKTEFEHIYLCAYCAEDKEVQAFFGLLHFVNSETKEEWIEFKWSHRCIELIKWVEETLITYQPTQVKEVAA